MARENHAIDFSRGKAAIAYVGETPWHGLGQKITANASIETWQKEAALDWTVEKATVNFCPAQSKKVIEFPNRTVLYRTDTKAPLGIVSDSHFKPVQPGQVLEFYRDLISDHGYKLETAGAIKGGQKVWALANIGQPFTVGNSKSGKKSDQIGSYLLFATGMDGSTATTIRLTTIRVVCNNTLTAAIPVDERAARQKGAVEGCLSISHRGKFDPDAAKEKLGIITRGVKPFAQLLNELASSKLSDEQAEYFFKELLEIEQAEEEAEDEKESNKVSDLMLAYKRGPGSDLPSADGTAWGAVNAVTYYVDHIVGRGVDTRLNKAWFGANDRLKTRALQLAMKSAQLIAA
jgi:phage/plasmid-like protein (TIGR03299 family)